MMKSLLKKVFSLIKLTIGSIVYFVFNKNTNFGYQSIITSFCNTKGASTRMMHGIISFFKKPYKIRYPVSGVLGELNKLKIKEIADEINKKGYYVFEQVLSEDTCNELMKFAIETEAYIRPVEKFDNSTGAILKLDKQKINRTNPITIRYDFLPEQLLENVEVQKLIADMSLITVAQEYLQCKPKSDVLGMWWHTAFSNEENPEAATMYHFDMDRVKWLKFFFYLTDTTKENGAHQFIEGSHNGNIPQKFLKRGYARIKAKEVLDYYGKDKEITYEAKKGTIIAEDTSGLHRGNPVQRDDRLLFQIQFSDSLFGAESKTTKINKDNIHKNLKQRMEEFPDMYEIYTSENFQFKGK